ncbi:hypothetical protein HPB51_008389 [Rhipicephalus microplus]|uniref:Uncharacterized protein n=1 Tax=Rhipicephalus microplus TaxID=6941 RepID=A0A9J6DUH9_RHIMP|nr:hypothetical protein HPB51_008389 [Rhipicephalus microplus]
MPTGNTKNDPQYARRSFCARDAESVARDARVRPSSRATELIAAAARSSYNCTKDQASIHTFHQTDIKWLVFHSQGGLDLTTLQPRYLLAALMEAAELADRPIYADPSDSPHQQHLHSVCARPQKRVDHTIPDSNAHCTEQPANLRDGHSKSYNRPTWNDKLKTPKGTIIQVSNKSPAPDPRDEELRARRVEGPPPLTSWEEWETLLRSTDPPKQKTTTDQATHVMQLHELMNA